MSSLKERWNWTFLKNIRGWNNFKRSGSGNVFQKNAQLEGARNIISMRIDLHSDVAAEEALQENGSIHYCRIFKELNSNCAMRSFVKIRITIAKDSHEERNKQRKSISIFCLGRWIRRRRIALNSFLMVRCDVDAWTIERERKRLKSIASSNDSDEFIEGSDYYWICTKTTKTLTTAVNRKSGGACARNFESVWAPS